MAAERRSQEATADDTVPVVLVQAPGLLDPASLTGVVARLDELEAAPGPAAIVVSGAGTDHAKEGARPGVAVASCLQRIVASGVPSVAAVPGDAGGRGLLLALACDYRVAVVGSQWRLGPAPDAGWGPFVVALLCEKLDPEARDRLLAGESLDGPAALGLGVVDELARPARVSARAESLARMLAGKHRPTYAAMKRRLYGDVAEARPAPPAEEV